MGCFMLSFVSGACLSRPALRKAFPAAGLLQKRTMKDSGCGGDRPALRHAAAAAAQMCAQSCDRTAVGNTSNVQILGPLLLHVFCGTGGKGKGHHAKAGSESRWQSTLTLGVTEAGVGAPDGAAPHAVPPSSDRFSRTVHEDGSQHLGRADTIELRASQAAALPPSATAPMRLLLL
jgi:hypothetical protein